MPGLDLEMAASHSKSRRRGFTKVPGKVKGERGDFPTNGAGTIGCLYVKIKKVNKSRCRPYITSFTKINSGWITGLKIKWIKGKNQTDCHKTRRK